MGFLNGNNSAEEDCDRPACDEIQKMLPKSMEEVKQLQERHKKNKDKRAMVECPPKSEELGQSTWNLLHSMAAWYPDKPSADQKSSISKFMAALGEFYPCTYCAKDFQECLQKSPVAAESRTDLCLWLCDQHNLVNKKLGKPLFDCQMSKLDERWRKSSNKKCNN